MSWGRLDDGAPDHPKFLRLAEEEKDRGASAITVWWAGLCYANRQKSRDGFIPAAKVRALWPFDQRVSESAASALVRVGLWTKVEGGYRIHDYNDYQPDAEKIAAKSEARRDAGRVGGLRSGEARRSKGEANGKQVASTLLQHRAKQTRSTSHPIPSHPVGSTNQQQEGDGRARRRLDPAPADHPVRLTLEANGGLLAGSDLGVVAAQVIALVRKRPTPTHVEIAEYALEGLTQALGSKGVDDSERYFLTIVQNLATTGGLEAERKGREPRSAPGAQGTGGGTDTAHELEQMRRAEQETFSKRKTGSGSALADLLPKLAGAK